MTLDMVRHKATEAEGPCIWTHSNNGASFWIRFIFKKYGYLAVLEKKYWNCESLNWDAMNKWFK